MYRILRQEGQLGHRGRCRPARAAQAPPVLEATGIHQVLAWDIPWCPALLKVSFIIFIW